MPRKRKDKENVIPSSSETELPKTFRDLTALTNVQLNGLLRGLDLPLKQKRNHKLTVVANYLNIPTVGENGEQDPFLQTLSDVKSMTDGWTGDMRQVPDIRLDSILGYLQAAHDIAATNHQGDFESYTSVSLRTYRALRAYDMWESGHISGYKFNKLCDIDGYCAVKCVGNPSGDTSGTQYDIVVIFKDCGSPIGGSCTCVAGLGEACTHIGGLMFGMEDFVSRGFKQLPDCESTTEKLCRWNVPRGPKVVPTQLSNVTVRKNVPGKVKKDKTFCASRYNPLPREKHSLDYEKLTQLHHALGIVNPNLPWVKAVAPAIIAEHRPPLVISPTPPPVASSLPDIVPFDHHVIVPAYTCEVETNLNPPSLTDKIKVTRDPELTRDSIKYSVDESDKIEQITREQSCSSLWYKYRRGIITSSNFQQVDSHINVIKTKGPTSATTNIIDNLIKGSKFKGNKATRYGQQQEPRAVAAYWESQSDQHTNFIIKESGLVISKLFPFLGASPDRIVSCDCHGQKILEVKCPFTLVDAARTIESMDFLIVSGDTVTLKKTGNSYYAQVQGQMGVTGIKQCELVVWDRQRLVIVQVPFNEPFWITLAHKLDTFHKEIVFPALVQNARGLNTALTERMTVQNVLNKMTKGYPCGKCGKVLCEKVLTNADASIQCECECKCQQWFHWKCVNYIPHPDSFGEESAWFCAHCVKNCDIYVACRLDKYEPVQNMVI